MKGSRFPDIDFNRLILPPVELKIVRRNDVFMVYDVLRKNYYILTEEEFIRQCFVKWMIRDKHYPASLMANEKGINLNGTYKRCDTIVFSSDGSPLMIIEYKSPKININQDVFNQIVRYNMVLKADFLVVSNGYENFYCKVDYSNHTIQYLPEMPDYTKIKR